MKFRFVLVKTVSIEVMSWYFLTMSDEHIYIVKLKCLNKNRLICTDYLCWDVCYLHYIQLCHSLKGELFVSFFLCSFQEHSGVAGKGSGLRIALE